MCDRVDKDGTYTVFFSLQSRWLAWLTSQQTSCLPRELEFHWCDTAALA